MLDILQNTIWAHRIMKEEAVNCRIGPGNAAQGFSIRTAMSVADIPARFKVGHVDPQEAMRAPTSFDPASVGWDAQGAEAREFRRNYDAQTSGPRTRQPYPQTASHELGWLLAPRGDVEERVQRKKLRMGFGWPEGPPAAFSEVSTAPPSRLDVARSELSAACPTDLSRAAPSQLSRSSAAEPPRGERADRSAAPRAAPSELSRAGASQVSGSPDSHVRAVRYSRSRSVPVLGKASLSKQLGRCEDGIEEALDESRVYLNRGAKGQRWTKFLIGTDATDFDNEFAKQNLGVPLYKMATR